MAGVGARILSYSDVVSFPASKADGAVTIQSAELYPLEKGSWSKAVIHMTWGDSFTDTVTVQPMVSWDGGTSWVQAGAYSEFKNGAASGDTYHILEFVPRLRVDCVFNATGEFSATSLPQIDVDFHEEDPESRRHFGYNNLTLSGDTLDVSTTANGDTVDLGSSSTVEFYVRIGDTGEICDTLALAFQHSSDALNWIAYKTPTATITNSSAINTFTKEKIGAESGDTTGLFRYVRSSVTSDGAGTVGADSELSIHIVGKEL